MTQKTVLFLSSYGSASSTSTFQKTGKLTPDEFVRAGDYLVRNPSPTFPASLSSTTRICLCLYLCRRLGPNWGSELLNRNGGILRAGGELPDVEVVQWGRRQEAGAPPTRQAVPGDSRWYVRA
jgi:hypothetical protein